MKLSDCWFQCLQLLATRKNRFQNQRGETMLSVKTDEVNGSFNSEGVQSVVRQSGGTG